MKRIFSKFPVLLIVFATLVFTGCSEEEVIPEDKFVHVYVDLMIVQDTTRSVTLPLDSLKEIVFAKHEITSELYDKTIAKYNSLPDAWEDFFEKAIAHLEELKTKKD